MKWTAFLLILIPFLALADTEPRSTKPSPRCLSYKICQSQTATGECVSPANGDELVVTVGRMAKYTFYSTESTASSYTCDIITNTTGFDQSVTDSTATQQVNTTSITDEEPVYTMVVLLQKLWVSCSEVADNAVNIDMIVCPDP